MDEEFEKLREINFARNPFRGVEMYVIPLIVATVAWFISVLVDKTCSSDLCEVGIDVEHKPQEYTLTSSDLTWTRSTSLVSFLCAVYSANGRRLREIVPIHHLLSCGGDVEVSGWKARATECVITFLLTSYRHSLRRYIRGAYNHVKELFPLLMKLGDAGKESVNQMGD